MEIHNYRELKSKNAVVSVDQTTANFWDVKIKKFDIYSGREEDPVVVRQDKNTLQVIRDSLVQRIADIDSLIGDMVEKIPKGKTK